MTLIKLLDAKGEEVKPTIDGDVKKEVAHIVIRLHDDKSMDLSFAGNGDLLKSMVKLSLRNSDLKRVIYDAVKEDMEESLAIARDQQFIQNSLGKKNIL